MHSQTSPSLEARQPHRTDARRGKRERVAPGVYRRAGKYLVQFTDEAGNVRFKTTTARNLTEAKAERERLRVAARVGDAPIGDRSLTVAALAESFLARERGPLGRRSKSTVNTYEMQLRAHVVPLLGPKTKAADVRVQHVRRMVDKLVAKR